ncbi:SAM-dependent methyltransferase [Lentzea sp. NPDC042327]|uniref:SAM-dependent methyltransferase n=1 Tax=Lentzea sp. NPDC042327 TaxID=3154801 RepID=UPI00340C803E
MPNIARVYDWYLGGTCNNAADREFGEKVASTIPSRTMVRDNRAFLRRVVEHLVKRGIRQFLDIGSGIPTVGNVHEIAAALDEGVRVVYVDHDPVVVELSKKLLDGNTSAVAVQGDLLTPATILEHPEVRELLDFDQPIGLLLFAILHFVHDEEQPEAVISAYCSALSPGSYVAISHTTDEGAADDMQGRMDSATGMYQDRTSPFINRDRATLRRWLDGFDVVPPGVTQVVEWNPDGEVPTGPDHRLVIGALARIPGE